MAYLLSLDAGTTSNRAILFDDSGNPIATHQIELTQSFPADGWVEHDGLEIMDGLIQSGQQAAKAGIQASQVVALGVTNQRETTLVWDRTTGQPIYPAIVWQDRRQPIGVTN